MLKFQLPYQYRIMRVCGTELQESEHIFKIKRLIQQYNIDLQTRKREVVFARQLLMWYLRKNTKISLKKIGKICGKRDHATVLHAEKTVDNYLDYNDKYFKQVTENLNNDLKQIFTIKAY